MEIWKLNKCIRANKIMKSEEFYLVRVQKERKLNLIGDITVGSVKKHLWKIKLSISMLCFGSAFTSVYKEPQSFPGRKIL